MRLHLHTSALPRRALTLWSRRPAISRRILRRCVLRDRRGTSRPGFIGATTCSRNNIQLVDGDESWLSRLITRIVPAYDKEASAKFFRVYVRAQVRERDGPFCAR